MKANLHFDDLIKIFPNLLLSKEFGEIHGFSFDSRHVKKGDLFFALSGDRFDGHLFLEEVQKKQAAAAVVEKKFRKALDLPLIYVDNVKQFLHQLAYAVIKTRQQKVIAITGTIGKTTTKDFIYTLIKKSILSDASLKSYNTQITVPISILNASNQAKVLILEYAMSQPGQIEKLVRLCPPYCGVITKVGIQHTSSFSDGLNGVIDEKGMIFCHPETEIGLAPLELKDKLKHFPKKLKTFSIHDIQADFFLRRDGKRVFFYKDQKEIGSVTVTFPLPAYDENYLIAFGIASMIHLPFEEFKQQSIHLKVPKMRFEKIEKNGITFINDAYNSCPDSIIAAFAGMKKLKGRKIGVISEMTDLGSLSFESHENIGKQALAVFDQLFLIGSKCQPIFELWQKREKECKIFEHLDNLVVELKKSLIQGDVILLKGARSHALERILNYF